MRGKLPVTLGVAAGVVLLDQLAKAVAVARLEGEPPVPIVGDLLRLVLVRNPGAAFSMAGNYTVVISLVAIVVSVVIVRTSRTMTSTWWAVVLGGVLGGALGNLIDRIVRSPQPLRGHVVDFIALPSFPVFNVADMALTCSAVLAIVLSLKGVEITATDPNESSQPAWTAGTQASDSVDPTGSGDAGRGTPGAQVDERGLPGDGPDGPASDHLRLDPPPLQSPAPERGRVDG